MTWQLARYDDMRAAREAELAHGRLAARIHRAVRRLRAYGDRHA